MIGKFAISQVLGIGAGYVSFAMGQELFGNVPFYIPIAAWLLTTLYTIAKL